MAKPLGDRVKAVIEDSKKSVQIWLTEITKERAEGGLDQVVRDLLETKLNKAILGELGVEESWDKVILRSAVGSTGRNSILLPLIRSKADLIGKELVAAVDVSSFKLTDKQSEGVQKAYEEALLAKLQDLAIARAYEDAQRVFDEQVGLQELASNLT